MASTFRRWLLLGPLATAVVASVVVTPWAHAAAPRTNPVVNSPKGFIGCLNNTPAWSQPTFTVYCVATQVLSTGADAGLLAADGWTCRYTTTGSELLSSSRTLLPPSALNVSSDGSFAFSARLPNLGHLSVVGDGAREHEDYAAPITRFIGEDGYRPQGYTLASPTLGLTTYGLDPNYPPYANPTSTDKLPILVSASVNRHSLSELIGTVWQKPTNGEWDFATC